MKMHIKLEKDKFIEKEGEVTIDGTIFKATIFANELLPYFLPYIKTKNCIAEDIVLINCYINSVSNNYIYSYDCDSVVFGDVDIDNLLIKEINVHFNELDYLIREKRAIYEDQKYILHSKAISNEILSNDEIEISLVELPKFTSSQEKFVAKYNNTVVANYINVFSINELYLKLRSLENVFGFIVGRKMSINSISIIDTRGCKYKVLNKMISNNDAECILKINDISLIKKIVNGYFTDNHIMAMIDSFYEYLYNNLDTVFMFASLCNIFEVLCCSHKYMIMLENSIKLINEQYEKDVEQLDRICEKLDDEEEKFVRSRTLIGKFSLKDKLLFLLTINRSKEVNDKVKEFVLKVNRTRNYYVHGNSNNNVFDYYQLSDVTQLLKLLAYSSIVNSCLEEEDKALLFDDEIVRCCEYLEIK